MHVIRLVDCLNAIRCFADELEASLLDFVRLRLLAAVAALISHVPEALHVAVSYQGRERVR